MKFFNAFVFVCRQRRVGSVAGRYSSVLFPAHSAILPGAICICCQRAAAFILIRCFFIYDNYFMLQISVWRRSRCIGIHVAFHAGGHRHHAPSGKLPERGGLWPVHPLFPGAGLLVFV